MTTDELKALVRDVPDFPVEGIVFKDLMPLIGNAEAFRSTIEHLAEWRASYSDIILGAEARGFIFGGALRTSSAAVSSRRGSPASSPGEGAGDLRARVRHRLADVHADAIDPGARVIVLDDVLATGGTAHAKVELVERLGAGRRRALRHRAHVFDGREKLDGTDGHALISY